MLIPTPLFFEFVSKIYSLRLFLQISAILYENDESRLCQSIFILPEVLPEKALSFTLV